jgi:hypothetical protein
MGGTATSFSPPQLTSLFEAFQVWRLDELERLVDSLLAQLKQKKKKRNERNGKFSWAEHFRLNEVGSFLLLPFWRLIQRSVLLADCRCASMDPSLNWGSRHAQEMKCAAECWISFWPGAANNFVGVDEREGEG